jgi:superfamily II DNA/RNA helicase
MKRARPAQPRRRRQLSTAARAPVAGFSSSDDESPPANQKKIRAQLSSLGTDNVDRSRYAIDAENDAEENSDGGYVSRAATHGQADDEATENDADGRRRDHGAGKSPQRQALCVSRGSGGSSDRSTLYYGGEESIRESDAPGQEADKRWPQSRGEQLQQQLERERSRERGRGGGGVGRLAGQRTGSRASGGHLPRTVIIGSDGQLPGSPAVSADGQPPGTDVIGADGQPADGGNGHDPGDAKHVSSAGAETRRCDDRGRADTLWREVDGARAGTLSEAQGGFRGAHEAKTNGHGVHLCQNSYAPTSREHAGGATEDHGPAAVGSGHDGRLSDGCARTDGGRAEEGTGKTRGRAEDGEGAGGRECGGNTTEQQGSSQSDADCGEKSRIGVIASWRHGGTGITWGQQQARSLGERGGQGSNGGAGSQPCRKEAEAESNGWDFSRGPDGEETEKAREGKKSGWKREEICGRNYETRDEERRAEGDGDRGGKGGVDDSLDAFMNSLEGPSGSLRRRPRSSVDKSGVNETESNDDEDFNSADGNGMLYDVGGADSGRTAFGVGQNGDLDEEDNPVATGERLYANDLVLPPIDHASVDYPSLVKNTYVAMPRLTVHIAPADVTEALRKCGVVISATGGGGFAPVPPIERFQDLALTLPRPLLGALLIKYREPTPVQKAVLPAALSGCDVIAVAKTGSGKTVSYALPLIAHLCAQYRRSVGIGGTGPTALVVAPTRELAVQVAGVIRTFAKTVGAGVACIVGGVAKYEQFKQLRDGGAAVVVCTPGRFIDMVRMKACSLKYVSFIVLDEADRMFDLGFGPQVGAVLSQVRPDSQCVFVSATFPNEVQRLAAQYAPNAVQLVAGRGDDADRHVIITSDGSGRGPSSAYAETVPLVSENVTEVYAMIPSETARFVWLSEQLPNLLSKGLVIVFSATRGGAAGIANQLRSQGHAAACIHGETDMADRSGLMRMFRSGEIRLLVATDVAARGLDIQGVRSVVNFEPAKTWDDHVHRCGRTGRAGKTGNAFTLLVPSTPRDLSFTRAACSAYRAAKVDVPPVVLQVVAASGNAGAGRNSGRSGGRSRGRGGGGGSSGQRRGLRGF